MTEWVADFWILLTASFVASSCALVGSFLILRRQALLGDAISHSVLLGIVLAYLISDSRSIIAMMVGAGIIGLATAWLSDQLNRLGKLQSDASIGIVFTAFFALGVILVTAFAEQVDLDQECVLYGEIAFVPFDTIFWGEQELGPRGVWLSGGVLLLNILFVWIGFERLKTLSFHSSLAASMGVSVGIWHYSLMTMVSLTTVSSFDAVGAILVVALLVIPASSAYLLAKNLKRMLWLSLVYAQLAVIMGYSIAYYLDSSIAASMAVAAGVNLLLTVSYVVTRDRRRQKQANGSNLNYSKQPYI